MNIGKITENHGQLLPLSEMSSLTLIRGATDMTQQLKKKCHKCHAGVPEQLSTQELTTNYLNYYNS